MVRAVRWTGKTSAGVAPHMGRVLWKVTFCVSKPGRFLLVLQKKSAATLLNAVNISLVALFQVASRVCSPIMFCTA
jgi:hypothetical protein